MSVGGKVDSCRRERCGRLRNVWSPLRICACTATFIFLMATGVLGVQASSPGHWADQWLAESQARQIVKGYPDGSIHPDRPVTRAEFCTMLIRLLGEESAASAARRLPSHFADVDPNYWGKGYLEIAREKEIFTGEGNDMASPDRSITRAEAATMIDRCRLVMGVPLPSEAGRPFSDESEIPQWAVDSVRRLSAGGAVEGDSDGRFYPQRNLSRAEAATLAIRLLDLAGGRWDVAGSVLEVGTGGGDLVLSVQGETVRFAVDAVGVQVFGSGERIAMTSLGKGQQVGLVLSNGRVSVVVVR